MSDERLKIKYVASVDGRREVKRDHEHFYQYITDDYPWVTPDPPKINRCTLFTAIAEEKQKREAIFEYLYKRKNRGEIEFVMIDSGGFQAGRFGLNPNQLVEEDYQIYIRNDWANAYVMPDMPPTGGDPMPVMQKMTEKTMSMTHELFDRLPAHLQAKAMPVFHVRNKEQLEQQYESYKPIIDTSKFVSYSIAAPTAASYNKFDGKNFELMSHAIELCGPDVHMHCLGISSPLSVFCMAYIGLSSYDTISAKKSAGYGLILFPNGWFHFTNRRPPTLKRNNRSVTFEKIEQIKEITGHRCPFCDDLDMLYKSTAHRRIHNFIVFDELNYIFRDMSLDHVYRYEAKEKTKKQFLELMDPTQLLF